MGRLASDPDGQKIELKGKFTPLPTTNRANPHSLGDGSSNGVFNTFVFTIEFQYYSAPIFY